MKCVSTHRNFLYTTTVYIARVALLSVSRKIELGPQKSLSTTQR